MDRKLLNLSDESGDDFIHVEKNHSLRSLTECSICYTQYDAQDHIPLALSCQHNICSSAVDSLFKNNKILCPFCKKISHYDSKTNIPKNYTMIGIINMQELAQVQIQVSLNKNIDMFGTIQKTITTIKESNVKIEALWEKLKKRIKKMIDFNKKLVRYLELFITKTSLDNKQVIVEQFEQLNDLVNLRTPIESCKLSLKLQKQSIQKIQDTTHYISCDQSIKEIIQIAKNQKDSYLNFTDLYNKNNIFKNEILNDYYNFNETVADNLLKHTNSITFRDRNFVIEKKKNFMEVKELLKFESAKNNCRALNTLGFLYYHGIEVEKNRNLAFDKFKKSANKKNEDANIVCYFLEENIKQKFDYLEIGILKNNPKTMAMLANIIHTDKLDNIKVKNKIITFWAKAAAEKGITSSMDYYAWCLQKGKHVKKNLDKACEYYYKAIEAGYYEAREDLDSLLQFADGFRENHPSYKTLESKNYSEYVQNQKVVLL